MFTAEGRSTLRLPWWFSIISLPWVGEIPGGGLGNPLQYSCGESHGQRSLEGYSPWDCKEWDTTKQLSTCAHTHSHTHTNTYLLIHSHSTQAHTVTHTHTHTHTQTHTRDPRQIQETRLSWTSWLSHPPLSFFSPCLRSPSQPTNGNGDLSSGGRDFPGGPVVKTSPSIAGGAGSILGQKAKIPHALGPQIQKRTEIIL